MKHLVIVDLSKRFGNLKNGIADIKKHRFLKALNFGTLLAKKIKPCWKPTVKSEDDAINFGVFDDSSNETI